MTITLLRDGEFIEVSPEDLKSGLKVEDKGRYFLFSMPGTFAVKTAALQVCADDLHGREQQRQRHHDAV